MLQRFSGQPTLRLGIVDLSLTLTAGEKGLKNFFSLDFICNFKKAELSGKGRLLWISRLVSALKACESHYCIIFFKIQNIIVDNFLNSQIICNAGFEQFEPKVFHIYFSQRFFVVRLTIDKKSQRGYCPVSL